VCDVKDAFLLAIKGRDFGATPSSSFASDATVMCRIRFRAMMMLSIQDRVSAGTGDSRLPKVWEG
jgi:hypothetical protein